jgi:hypothetical protein
MTAWFLPATGEALPAGASLDSSTRRRLARTKTGGRIAQTTAMIVARRF